MTTASPGTLKVLAGPPANKTERLKIEAHQWQPLQEKGQCKIVLFQSQQEGTKKLRKVSEVYQIKQVRYYNGPLEIRSYIERHGFRDPRDGFHIVVMDDCQCEEGKPEMLAYTLDEIVNAGHYVLVAGVDQDYKGTAYEATSYLMSLADEVEKVRSRCSICGAVATKSEYVGDKKGDLFNNDKMDFEPRCENHWHTDKKKVGDLKVIAGPMVSGKTWQLLKKVDELEKRNLSYQIVKPVEDTRWGSNKIRSRGILSRAIECRAKPVKEPNQIEKTLKDGTNYVLIDEAHFFGEDIVNVVGRILQRGINVFAAGLDTDYQGAPFKSVAKLMALAREVKKTTAICAKKDCERPATRTRRKKSIQTSNRLLPGDQNKYKPLCRKHHNEYIRDNFLKKGLVATTAESSIEQKLPLKLKKN